MIEAGPLMPPSIRIHTDSGSGVVSVINAPADLRRALDLLRKQRPGRHFLVRLLNDSNDEMMLGLGPRDAIVTITEVRTGVVRNALGDRTSSTTVFTWGEHAFEMGPENLLAPALARRIAAEWAFRNVVDTDLRWEVAFCRAVNGGA